MVTTLLWSEGGGGGSIFGAGFANTASSKQPLSFSIGGSSGGSSGGDSGHSFSDSEGHLNLQQKTSNSLINTNAMANSNKRPTLEKLSEMSGENTEEDITSASPNNSKQMQPNVSESEKKTTLSNRSSNKSLVICKMQQNENHFCSEGLNSRQEKLFYPRIFLNIVKGLNKQKSDLNVTNVVSADQIGKFPDDNVGDVIKRIAGVSMQGDQGEARNIVMRGLGPGQNSVTLNGDRIPSAEGDNRNVQLDLIPSAMIQSIEVNKTLTPDMEADAIGGSVNLITRSNPTGFRASATVAGGGNPIRSSGYNSNVTALIGNEVSEKLTLS